jgi:GT2 family glycosyltransferase
MITRDRGEQIRIALGHLLEMPERPQVIVVDNGSSDRTAEIARAMGPRVEVIALGRNLGGAGRNVGVARAETPYIAFSDDDSWWQPGALARAVELFKRHPGLGLIPARILVGPEERVDPLCRAMATGPLARNGWPSK